MLVISKSLFDRNQSLFSAGLLENFVVAPTYGSGRQAIIEIGKNNVNSLL